MHRLREISVRQPFSACAENASCPGILADSYTALKPDPGNADGYVFERNGVPLDDRALLRQVIRPIAQRLGVYFEGFGWHTFRRQNLTVLQEEGATASEAMAQAGHSRPGMTGEYTIVGVNRREAAVLRLQARLFGETGKEESSGLCGDCAGMAQGCGKPSC